MSDDTKAAFIKAMTSWGGVGLAKFLTAIGVTSWGEFSALMASIVSVLFIIDWIVKKVKSFRRGK